MPIQFPPTVRGNPFDRWIWQGASTRPAVRCPLQQVRPNLARVGQPFTFNTLNPGFPMPISVATNVRLLGQMYQDVARTALVNPAFAIGDPDLIEHGTDNSRAYQRVTGTKNMQMSGISRDSSGAVLGVCRVMIFRADDKSFVGETVSDGSGNWTFTMPNPNSGPFFLVEYKAGIPDVAGTSLNTLTPIEV